MRFTIDHRTESEFTVSLRDVTWNRQMMYFTMSYDKINYFLNKVETILCGDESGVPSKAGFINMLRMLKFRNSGTWRVFFHESTTARVKDILSLEGSYPLSEKNKLLISWNDSKFGNSEGCNIFLEDLVELSNFLQKNRIDQT